MLEADNSQQSQQSTSQGAAPAAAPAPEPAPRPEVGVEPPSASELMQTIIAEHRAVEQEQPQQPAQQQPAQQPAAPAPETNQPAGQGDYQPNEYTAALAEWMETDRQSAYELGAEILNAMPDLIEHNRDYLLSVLGLPGDAAAAEREIEARNQADFEASRQVSTAMSEVFDEFVEQGKAAGLNDLEAAGLAAIAYREFEQQYWTGDGSWRGQLDDWHGRVKGGNKLHIGDARNNFRKAFDTVYGKLSATHKSQRTADAQPSIRQSLGLDPDLTMKEILRERGVSEELPQPGGVEGARTGKDLMLELLNANKKK
jgi:hypothetical protein